METYKTQIAHGLAEMGKSATEDSVALLAAHLDLVAVTNESFNLTRIDPADAVAMHVLDSAAGLPFIAASPAGRYADIGSGAGFPGLTLSILTGRPVELVESVKKKAAFLERAAEELCLKATVHPIRAEELAQAHPGAFAVITARALSSLPSLVELASPLLKRDGRLICFKGRPDEEEIARGDAVGKMVGMVREDFVPVTVPGVEASRVIITYRRTGRASVRLPRRPGMAQRNPLA